MPSYVNTEEEKNILQTAVSRESLAVVVSANINVLCSLKAHPKKTIAQLCGVSQSLVSRWTSRTNPLLPGIEHLLTVAAYLGVPASYLLTEHREVEDVLPDWIQTYSDALIALISLSRRGIVSPDQVNDTVLKYLLKRFWHLSDIGLNEADFSAWIEKILRDFAVPMANSCDSEALFSYISRNEKGIAAIDEDTRYRNIVRILNTPGAVERIYRQMEEELQEEDPK